MTAEVTYQGGLRTVCNHLKSGDRFITDAPTDNNGKGEAFSPTDTVATALASCMLTIMGIKADSLGIDLKGSLAQVEKTMTTNPRRISKITINIFVPGIVEEHNKKILENSANNCPVHHSLHPDIKKEVTFHWK